jgi:hypothetical protein
MARRRKTRKTNARDAVIKSAEMIGWAIGGLEREIIHTRERLAALTAQAAKLRARIGGRQATIGERVQPAADTPVPRKRRKMSAAARKRMSEMMKKRWAERKKNKK